MTLQRYTCCTIAAGFFVIWKLARRLSTPSSECCGPGCRSALGAVDHYDIEYLRWQQRLGLEKAAMTNWTRLLGIQPGDTVRLIRSSLITRHSATHRSAVNAGA
jgi:hypothetical protein